MLNKMPQAHAWYQVRQSNECKHVTAMMSAEAGSQRSDRVDLPSSGLASADTTVRVKRTDTQIVWSTHNLCHMMMKAHHERYCYSAEVGLKLSHSCVGP